MKIHINCRNNIAFPIEDFLPCQMAKNLACAVQVPVTILAVRPHPFTHINTLFTAIFHFSIK